MLTKIECEGDSSRTGIRLQYAAAAIAVGVAAAVYFAVYGTPVFPLDDAYITLHNAVALTRGADPNFPGVPALTGSTSVIHTVLVAALALVMPPAWAMASLSWFAVLLYVLGLLRLGTQFRLPKLLQALLVVYGVTVGRTPHHLLNGLETGFAMAAVVWAIALASEAAPRRLTMFVCGLLPFIRPELGVISIGLWILQGVRRFRAGVDWVRPFALDSAVLAAAALPWMILLWANTGSPVVNTAAAKQAFYAEAVYPWKLRLHTTGMGLAVFAYTISWGIALLLLLVGDSLGFVGLAFLLALLASMFHSLPHATTFYEGRYMYLIVPWMLYGAALLWKRLRGCLRPAVTVLIAILIADNVLYVPQNWQHYLNARRFTQTELQGVADFCNSNLPQGARIMVHDIGYMSFATQFELIDAVGLKNSGAVVLHKRFTASTGGASRKQAIHELAISTNPGYLVVLNGWDGPYEITKGLRDYGWRLERVQLPDQGRRAYSLYRMEMPAQPIAVRTDISN